MVKQKPLDSALDIMRRKHLSYRTEQDYIYWMRKFILFQGKRHPGEMGEAEVSEFLTFCAKKKVSSEKRIIHRV